MTAFEYERLRGDADRFAVVPGHEIPAVETVVERTTATPSCARLGSGAAIAEATDPRA